MFLFPLTRVGTSHSLQQNFKDRIIFLFLLLLEQVNEQERKRGKQEEKDFGVMDVIAMCSVHVCVTTVRRSGSWLSSQHPGG